MIYLFVCSLLSEIVMNKLRSYPKSKFTMEKLVSIVFVLCIGFISDQL
jgi:hypothetical protein